MNVELETELELPSAADPIAATLRVAVEFHEEEEYPGRYFYSETFTYESCEPHDPAYTANTYRTELDAAAREAVDKEYETLKRIVWRRVASQFEDEDARRPRDSIKRALAQNRFYHK
jgi:hypothetical protein